jgi:hypothetical protein
VFVSYLRDDQHVVERMVKNLRAHRIRVWMDRDSIPAGTFWADQIRDSIGRGALFLACFSGRFSERSDSYMRREVDLAIDELARRRDVSWFIPIRLDDTPVPPLSMGGQRTIADLQWIDYIDPTTGDENVLRSVGGNGIVFGNGSIEDRLRTATELWIKNGRGVSHALTGEAFIVAQCWLYFTDRYQMSHAEYDPEIAEYIAASRRRLGGDAAWDEILRRKIACDGCEDTFRVENLSICTDCFNFFCYQCKGDSWHPGSCGGLLVG